MSTNVTVAGTIFLDLYISANLFSRGSGIGTMPVVQVQEEGAVKPVRVREVELSDIKPKHRGWRADRTLGSEDVKKLGHFIDLNELTAAIESGELAKMPNVGVATLKILAHLVNERVDLLGQQESQTAAQ